MKKPLSTKSKFLKRDPVKYIRDKAKSSYEKGSECHICGKIAKLDFHHFYSLTPLLDKWLQEKQKARPDHYTEEYITNDNIDTMSCVNIGLYMRLFFIVSLSWSNMVRQSL